MNQVEQLYDLTKELYQALQTFPEKDERENYIAKIDDILEQRQKLIDSLPQNYNAKEKKLGQEIIKLNQEIDTLLKKFFSDIKKDFNQIKQKKLVHNKYAKKYSSADGMFFDKRK